jgi:replicative DNA helicase
MPNPLFQQLSQNNENGFNNPFQMIQKFNEFRQNFTGDPKQMVEQLLQSGRMSQQQFQQLSQMASEFQKLGLFHELL